MSLRAGDPVTFADPLGYSGTGVVEEVQDQHVAAVLIRVESITDRTSQVTVGRSVWILTPHVRPA